MRTTGWAECAFILLAAVIGGGAGALREESPVIWGGAVAGAVAFSLVSRFVWLVTLPLEREVEALRARVAELERRGGPGPGGG